MELADVTLREADQMPGRDYTVEQKVAAGRALDRLGLPLVQAGFPITGETDREAVRRLSGELDADVVSLARAREGDVDAAIDADTDAVDIIISTSEAHLGHVLGMTREEATALLRDAADHAAAHGLAVHVSFVDGFRTDPAVIADIIERFPDVDYATIADTVGARTPRSVTDFLETVGESVDLSRVGVHFHEDLGVGTANALAAADAGVGKADVSVASLGERAGNVALEEVVVAGATDGPSAFVDDPGEVIPTCEAVLDALDESVPPRKAILGEEVTEHESGIHTAAMLEHPSTFEPFDPSDFGGRRRLLFGSGTGRSGARQLLERAGVEPTDETVAALLDRLRDAGPLETDDAVALARDEFGGS